MMHLFGRSEPSGLLAFLAKRMLRYVSVPDALPAPAVAFSCCRVALIFVVSCVHFLLVFLAESSVRQLRTAGIAARALGFSRHSSISNAGKSPQGIYPKGFFGFYISFHAASIAQMKANKPPSNRQLLFAEQHQ
jgi:hypothetical protein